MRTRLGKALRDIAHVNGMAKQVVERHFSGYTAIASSELETGDAQTVEELNQLISNMMRTIDEQEQKLETLIDELETYRTTNPRQEIDKFKDSIKHLGVGDTKAAYTAETLAQYKPYTRYIMSVALSEHARSRQSAPAMVWTQTLETAGK